MRIAVGADHAGYPLKVDVVRFLEEQGTRSHGSGNSQYRSSGFP